MDNFKGQNILNLVKEFPNDDACKAYLSKLNGETVLNALNVVQKKVARKQVLHIIVMVVIMLKVQQQKPYFIK